MYIYIYDCAQLRDYTVYAAVVYKCDFLFFWLPLVMMLTECARVYVRYNMYKHKRDDVHDDDEDDFVAALQL